MDRKQAKPPAADLNPAGQPEGSAPRVGILVAIGGSAGALEPLQRFFEYMPSDSGMAFVVVQHLERHHPSLLAELLGRHTKMPVKQVQSGTLPQPNHVYIIAPNTFLTLRRGLLQVGAIEAPGARKPIDAFMTSLAENLDEGAIGIILSGTGADGTIGMRAIKEHGGFTLAQSPETAKFEDMPNSVITAGLADHALRVEDMPAQLLSYAERVVQLRQREARSLDDELNALLGPICDALQKHTGHDFSQYKKGTLLRRVGRRVRLQDSISVADYLRRLETSPPEAELLLRDLLIGVTQFFRDPEVFQALADQVVPPILLGAGASGAVRVWVPGCSSGEEVYSIAILMSEQLSRLGDHREITIFGTDIDTDLLAIARQGRYSNQIREHVSPERLERHFTPEGESFQISKDLRKMCIFSVHSMIKDPPFSSLHLISCRNLLIYLGTELQKKLVPLFHFGLRPGGFLLLGPSEGLSAHTELFATVDKKFRIFRRSDVVGRPLLEMPLVSRRVPTDAHNTHPLEPERPRQEPMLSQAFERMIRTEYAPPSVVINEVGDILYFGGQTSRYLQPREGQPTNNVFDQAQTNLRVELRAALSVAVKTRSKVVRSPVQLEVNGELCALRVTVRPMPGLLPETGLYAVVMQELGSGGQFAPQADATAREALIIELLEDELRNTRRDLESAMESLETSNEELKSSNEELTSTNEELQSANEELQSSREELQTVNDELLEKVEALAVAHGDLQNLYAGSHVGTIFIDRELRVVSFTPAAATLFQLLEQSIGRPFGELATRFRGQFLATDAREVLRTNLAVERRLQTVEGNRWFLVRLLPYLSPEKVTVGVGVTCIDVTDLHRAEEAERHYGRLSDAIFVWRLDNGVETWSPGAEELYGFAFNEIRGRVPHEVLKTALPRPWKEITEALRGGGRWEGEFEHRTKDGRAIHVSAKLELTRGEDGVERVLESDRDISAHMRAESALRDADRHKNEFLASLSHELRNPLAPIRSSLHILQNAEPGGGDARRALAIADRQVGQLVHLVDDLLDMTRITRNLIQLRRRRLDLNELVRRTVEDYQSVFETNELHLEVTYDSESVTIDADPVRVIQILGNLLQNAAKFTPSGGSVRVFISADPVASRAVVRLTDTGIGMEPETLAGLFNPFMRAESNLGRTTDGLGLGLALVKGLVELHGGEVTAASAGLGMGTEFTVRLPLALAAAPDLPASSVDQGPTTRRVLIIEDNVDSAESMRIALELDGHEVAVAHDGAKGVAMAVRFLPDILLCDIGLPGMDGFEVAGAFRSNPLLQGTFLVALTGKGLPEDIRRTAEAGFACHLTKPPLLKGLLQLVASVTQLKSETGHTGPR